MKAILFVGHGSRGQLSNKQFIQFANAVRKSCSAPIFRYAFLELAEPSIEAEIKLCVENGATEIIVFPLLLLTAGHAKIDIPYEVAKGEAMFPHVMFRIEKPLGIQEILISILENRLLEKDYCNDQRNLVVFVGRGSNDPAAIADFEKIAQLLREKLNSASVETSFLVGGHVSFEDCILGAKERDYEQIYVLPYILFKGLLLSKMVQFVKRQKDGRFIMCNQIGDDQRVVQLVSSLLNNFLENEYSLKKDR